jgi:hypothetical protein
MISPVTGSIIMPSTTSVVSVTAISFRIRPNPTHRYSDSPDNRVLRVGSGLDREGVRKPASRVHSSTARLRPTYSMNPGISGETSCEWKYNRASMLCLRRRRWFFVAESSHPPWWQEASSM